MYTLPLWKIEGEVVGFETGSIRMWIYHKAHDCVLLVTHGSWPNQCLMTVLSIKESRYKL